jgi:hypothetical protein
VTERQRMAKRNELRSLLGRLNSGNARGRKHIAFGDSISCDQIERFPTEPNLSARNSCSFAQRLPGNVNHLGPTIGTNVTKFLHFYPACHSERKRNL